eukprot:scaffold247076_cov19-Tisochrysis_lutea.AAC.2
MSTGIETYGTPYLFVLNANKHAPQKRKSLHAKWLKNEHQWQFSHYVKSGSGKSMGILNVLLIHAQNLRMRMLHDDP